MSTDNKLLHALYRDMRRIRSLEERVSELFVRSESAGSMLHLSIGEEGVAGVVRAMEGQDSFTTHHRGHGIFVARGAEPARMLAEIAGKASGYCRGKGGSMHIADMGLGHLGANAIVGGGISHAVGAALAYKRKKQPRVSVAFFGDGAMQQGILYESMNLAALWSLPVVFVCINNQYGMGTRIDRATANTAFDERARAFGLDGVMVDGTDVELVHEAAERLIGSARRGQPGFMSLTCYRFYGHARMDKSPYRDAAEEAAGRARDPLDKARQRLADRGVTTAELNTLDSEIAAEMDAALESAIKAALPPVETMFEDVFAPDQPKPTPLRAHLNAMLSEASR
ncbi:MAG: thiamine pyrophosphate-dependent dehydrogenase E1 component subunit alpha [Dongiaceae bacterium]